MKTMKLLTVFIPLLFGTAAALWTSFDLWYDMKEGLIAFLGFLAASLVQVMPITANFLQSDRLTPMEAERLTASLTKQQQYWMGLLSSTIAAMVFVIVGAALKGRIEKLTPLFFDIGWSSVVVFLIVSSVSFVLIKMLGLFEGMMSLHNLRGELVINAAKRDVGEKIAAIQKQAEQKTAIVPQDYGQIIRPH
jgi:hypothetical protein